MQYRATFVPKKKAKKEKPHMMALSFLVEKDTQAKMKIKAEKLLRAEGGSVTDYFKPMIEETATDPKGVEPDAGTTAKQKSKESAPTGDTLTSADQISVDTAASIAREIEEAIAALEPGDRYMRFGVPEHIYHASRGIGSSALKEAFKSMAHYRTYCDQEKEISPQLQAIFNFGRAVHCLVLEPDSYAQRFATIPPYIKRKASEDYKEWAAQIGDRTPITSKESDDVQGICMSFLLKVSKPRHLLTCGTSEVSFWYRDESGLVLKARVDHWHDVGVCVDLKTTRDASPKAFAKTVRYEYCAQSALYKLVTGANDFVFVGVDKVKPYAHSMARVPEEIEKITRHEMREVLDKIAECERSEDWPGYDVDTIHEAEVWPSEIKKLEELELGTL